MKYCHERTPFQSRLWKGPRLSKVFKDISFPLASFCSVWKNNSFWNQFCQGIIFQPIFVKIKIEKNFEIFPCCLSKSLKLPIPDIKEKKLKRTFPLEKDFILKTKFLFKIFHYCVFLSGTLKKTSQPIKDNELSMLLQRLSHFKKRYFRQKKAK